MAARSIGRFRRTPTFDGCDALVRLSRSALKPALLQARDCFAHHSVTEVALRDPKQFGAAPFLLNRVDVGRSGDQIEITRNKEYARGVARRFIVQRRAEMKMPRHQFGCDLRAA